MSVRGRSSRWGLILVLGVVAYQAYPFRARGIAEVDLGHASALEECDESKVINVVIYPRTIAHGGSFVVMGQVFRPGDDAPRDRQAAIKTYEDAIPVLEAQIRKGFLEADHRKAAERSLVMVKSQLKAALAHQPSEFRWVHAVLVPGANQRPYAQYSTLFPWTTAIVGISTPEKGIGTYQLNLSANVKPGPYTLILTPLDPTSVNGAVLAGGSDAVTISVAE